MGIGSWFGLNKNEFVIGGVKTKLPETDDQTMDLAAQLARQLGSKLPTEQDVYWFVIEFYDRASAFNHSARGVLGNLPISIPPIRAINTTENNRNVMIYTYIIEYPVTETQKKYMSKQYRSLLIIT